MNKHIVFANCHFIWHVRHEKALFGLMPDTSKHLAWSSASKIGLHSPQRDFSLIPCHMPDMPDVFKTIWFYRRLGGIYSPIHTTSGMAVYPPLRKEQNEHPNRSL